MRKLPGKPDIVFPRQRLAVFCDGDFWHGRAWTKRKRKLMGGWNSSYWVTKIKSNIDRDKRQNAQLPHIGWTILRLWETDILTDTEKWARKIARLVWSKRGHSRG